MKKYSRQKDSVDLEVIVWLRHSTVLGPYYGSLQPCIIVCAECLSIFLLSATITRCNLRSHAAGTVLYLQVPSPQPASTVLDPSTSKSQYRSPYTGPSNASYSRFKASRDCTNILKRFHAFFLPLCILINASCSRCRHNRWKLITYRATLPSSWENGTWQVPSQLSHSDVSYCDWWFSWRRLQGAQWLTQYYVLSPYRNTFCHVFIVTMQIWMFV